MCVDAMGFPGMVLHIPTSADQHNFYIEKENIFALFLNIEMVQVVEIFPCGTEDLFILHGQYQGAHNLLMQGTWASEATVLT